MPYFTFCFRKEGFEHAIILHAIEKMVTRKKMVGGTTKAPNIATRYWFKSLESSGADKGRCAADSLRAGIEGDNKPKIDQLEKTVRGNEDIIGFHIAVNIAHLVDVV